jgi:anion-transporting  ArsA/GET3 family ATPase
VAARRATKGETRASLDAALAGREVVVTCGAGGVGKTTMAASIAARLAHEHDARVVVLTIDPARRLADALGLDAVGDVATRVDPDALADVGLGGGQLWASMLDTKAGWDALIRRHAPDDATRDAMLANSVYANISERFIQSHDYLAAERVHELHASGNFDVVVVDTPPAAHALDFFDAPTRMTELFSGRLVKLLTVSTRNRVLTLASKPFYQVADRILGRQLLGDLIEFFTLLQRMERGFVDRARQVETLLESDRTAFVIVCTTDAAPAREARQLLDALSSRDLTASALIVNKALPPVFTRSGGSRVAKRLHDDAAGLATELALGRHQRHDVESALRAMSELVDGFSASARRGATERSTLGLGVDAVVEIPLLDGSLTDLDGIARIAELL